MQSASISHHMNEVETCPHCAAFWVADNGSAGGGRRVVQCNICGAPRCKECSFINHPSILPYTATTGSRSATTMYDEIAFCTICGAPMLTLPPGTTSTTTPQPTHDHHHSNHQPPRLPPHPPPQTPIVPPPPFSRSGPSTNTVNAVPCIAPTPQRQQQASPQQQQAFPQHFSPTGTTTATTLMSSPSALRRDVKDRMVSLVERTQRNCQAAGTIFVDVWDVASSRSISGSGSGGVVRGRGDAQLLQEFPLAFAALPPLASPLPHAAATLIPAHKRAPLTADKIAHVLEDEVSALFGVVKNLFRRSSPAKFPPPPSSSSEESDRRDAAAAAAAAANSTLYPAHMTIASPLPHRGQGGAGGGSSSNEEDHHRSWWHLIDPCIGVQSSDICQGALGDCWFLSAVAVLAHRHAELISSLFINNDVNAEGVFGVRLCIGGVWRCVIVGPTFPSTDRGRRFAFARNRSETALWVPVLEKAFAHAHGGFANIIGGRPRDALMALTGMPCVFLRLGHNSQQQHRSRGGFTDDDDGIGGSGGAGSMSPVQLEELQFSKLSSYIDAKCIVCACCGGTADSDAVAARIGLEINHAYSILAVTNHAVTRERVVALRNPWGKSKYRGMNNPPQGAIGGGGGAGVVDGADGVFWMTFSEFVTCFTEADICLTRTYETNFQALGLRISGVRGGGGNIPNDPCSDPGARCGLEEPMGKIKIPRNEQPTSRCHWWRWWCWCCGRGRWGVLDDVFGVCNMFHRGGYLPHQNLRNELPGTWTSYFWSTRWRRQHPQRWWLERVHDWRTSRQGETAVHSVGGDGCACNVTQSFDERMTSAASPSPQGTNFPPLQQHNHAFAVGGEPYVPEPSTPHRHDRRHTDVMILVLRLSRAAAAVSSSASSSSGRWVLHGSPARCSCDGVITHTTFYPPGEYCIVPMSISGTTAPQQPMLSLNVTILSESPNILGPTSIRQQPVPHFPPLSHIMYHCCRASPSFSVKQLCGDSVRIANATCGHLNIVALENLGNSMGGQQQLRGGALFSSTADVLVDSSESRGVVLATSSPLAGSTKVTLEEGQVAIAVLSVPEPHGGTFSTQFLYRTSATVRSGPPRHSSGGSSGGGGLLSAVVQGIFGGGGGGSQHSSSTVTSSAGSLFDPFVPILKKKHV
ncbi:peptidase, putative [Bodo saltans]|uniref:Peptidase, putative n=1 Tax=Bodo saltans TaxID=75058 RepID=A0A0S4JEM8_BODSA|nr:peptidase, putative [Bodo saltans]|eukprot:CUG88575.1 peptidase, putative [Bodo saltans]